MCIGTLCPRQICKIYKYLFYLFPLYFFTFGGCCSFYECANRVWRPKTELLLESRCRLGGGPGWRCALIWFILPRESRWRRIGTVASPGKGSLKWWEEDPRWVRCRERRDLWMGRSRNWARHTYAPKPYKPPCHLSGQWPNPTHFVVPEIRMGDAARDWRTRYLPYGDPIGARLQPTTIEKVWARLWRYNLWY